MERQEGDEHSREFVEFVLEAELRHRLLDRDAVCKGK